MMKNAATERKRITPLRRALLIEGADSIQDCTAAAQGTLAARDGPADNCYAGDGIKKVSSDLVHEHESATDR
jgi:hypothetical protein